MTFFHQAHVAIAQLVKHFVGFSSCVFLINEPSHSQVLGEDQHIQRDRAVRANIFLLHEETL